MGIRLPTALACAAMVLWPWTAAAQSDDRDYLTALLEDNLSGAGRAVVITGFEGALSSQARMTSLTIADDTGVWIALKDVVLDWQRSDLLVGKISVTRLTAAEISLSRIPNSGAQVNAEAPAFALPELPIAIDIGTIAVEKLHLAAPVLGQEVNASAAASMQLAGGEGQGKLTLLRDVGDIAQGRAEVDIAFVNATRLLRIDLNASETAGGILAQLLGIPDAPALELAVKGDAPLSDFAADLALRSDGAPRFAGRVAWSSVPQSESQAFDSTRFDVDLAGDLSPLVKTEFRPFFGAQTQLRAQGQTRADGGFDMPDFVLTSAAMDISGRLSLAPSGQPDAFALTGKLRSPDGGPLTLPLALDNPAAITSAQIAANFDITQGEAFRVAGQLNDWQQSDLRVSNSQFSVEGRIERTQGGTRVSSTLSFTGEGVQPASGALSRAIGTVIWGDGDILWQQGGPLALSNLRLMGEAYHANIDGIVGGLASGLTFSGTLEAAAQDFARFSGILGRPIGGAGRIAYRGDIALLTRAFDGALHLQSEDLALGIAAVDASLKGTSLLTVSARRDETGIDLRAVELSARGTTAQLSGKIAQTGSDVAGRFALLDVPMAERGFGGALSGQIALTGLPDDAVIKILANANGLALPNDYLRKIGTAPAEVVATIALKNLVPQIVSAQLSSSQLQVQIGQDQLGGAYAIAAELADLAVALPEFPGRVTLTGSAMPQGDGASLDLRLTGPAQLAAQIDGQISAKQSNDVTLTGRADAGLLNAFIAPRSIAGDAQFDLRLRGAAAIGSISGDIRIAGGSLADPSLPFSLRDLTASATVVAGKAQVLAKANASTGGSVTAAGEIAVVAPYAGDVAVTLAELGLRDPELYQSSVSGNLRLTGPLLGNASLRGALELGRSEVQLRVPKIIEGAPLPDLQHKGDSAAVQATRRRAGFDERSRTSQGGARYGLDITLRAPNRLFVRGRGLDAELGGEVRLQGDTSNVQPNGSFDLVQGHFDILTTRLDLEAVRLELRGAFIPYLSLRATSNKGGIITTAIIDGPALDPEFKFASVPELPEEEVLSQLLFDQSLRNLTALQTVQLGSAVASLTGRGEGAISRIRKALRLDNLDVQSDEAGNSALKLGKYVSKNVYSELSSEGLGKQSLDFTFTLNEKIKLKAGAQSSGNTSVGIELETNY